MKTFNERFDEKYNSVTSCKDDVCDECHNGDNCYIVEDIKQFIQSEIDEVLEDIEKQRIPPNTLVAVTIWNRCIDKSKQIINKKFKG